MHRRHLMRVRYCEGFLRIRLGGSNSFQWVSVVQTLVAELAIVVEKGREFVLVRRDNHRRCLLFLRRRSRLLVMRLHRRIRGGGRLVVHRVFRSLRRRFEMYCSRRSGDILDLANGRRTSLFLRNHYNLQILFEEHVDGWDLLSQQQNPQTHLLASVVDEFHRRVFAIAAPC